MRIAIVGGGVSGLAAAFYLSRLGAGQVSLLEASPRLGGIITSKSREGFLMEGGPDAFVTKKPQALQLCRDLGLEDDLIPTRPEHRRSYTWQEGQFHPLPRAFLSPPIEISEIISSPLLSPAGKERAGKESSIPPEKARDESVADFARRRFGSEVLDRIIAPLVAGVYGGDAAELSLRAAFPRLWEHERRHGCLTGQREVEASGESSDIFRSLRGGMVQLIEALTDRISPMVEWRTSTAVSCLSSRDGVFGLETDEDEQIEADAVILATPARVSARILKQGYPQIAEELGQIRYSHSILVNLGYPVEILQDWIGTGLIIPPAANRDLLACTWVNNKFQGRSPEGKWLVRGFIAGKPADRLLDKSDEDVVDAVCRELREILGIDPAPRLRFVHRWPFAMPVYRLGHADLVERLKDQLSRCSGLYCIGNYFDGVGIPDSIRHARQAAEDLSRQLA